MFKATGMQMCVNRLMMPAVHVESELIYCLTVKPVRGNNLTYIVLIQGVHIRVYHACSCCFFAVRNMKLYGARQSQACEIPKHC